MHNVIGEPKFKAYLKRLNTPAINMYVNELNRYFRNPDITTTRLSTANIKDMYHFMAHIQLLTFNAITKTAKAESEYIPYAVADLMLSSLDSLDRGTVLMDLFGCMKRDAWCKLFVATWTRIETADFIGEELTCIIERLQMRQLRKYMYEDSMEAWDAAPDTLKVYRGCANNGVDGYSWTLDKEIAEDFCKRKVSAFSGGMRFRLLVSTQSNEMSNKINSNQPRQVKLLEGTVKKKDAVFFWGRGESEVFSPDVKITGSTVYSLKSANDL